MEGPRRDRGSSKEVSEIGGLVALPVRSTLVWGILGIVVVSSVVLLACVYSKEISGVSGHDHLLDNTQTSNSAHRQNFVRFKGILRTEL